MKRKDVNNPFSGYLPAPPAYIRPQHKFAIVKNGKPLMVHSTREPLDQRLHVFPGAEVVQL
jgi:hypothetical protein